MTRKILMSAGVLIFVAALVVGATGAFYGDTETSTGNTFTAGAIDLKVDNVSHYNGMVCKGLGSNGGTVYTWQPEVGFTPTPEHFPQAGTPCNSAWHETDLQDGVQTFFNFLDLKPGDYGENTISLHVYNNDAWGQLILGNIIDRDNDCTEPEQDMENGACSDPDGNGEVDKYLSFTGWLDQGLIPGFQCGTIPNNAMCQADPAEGDNEYQESEGPKFWNNETIDNIGPFELSEVLGAAYTHKGCNDVDGNTDYASCHGLAQDGRMVKSTTYYLGLAWELPLLTTGNDAQTDSYNADITFQVEQHRNNSNPFGEVVTPPEPAMTVLGLENKDIDGTWAPFLADGTYGTLSFISSHPTFDYTLNAYGLVASTSYSIIYYADPWPGNNPGALIGSFMTNGSGNATTSGNVELGTDLPNVTDENYPTGAKIWVIKSSEYTPNSVNTWPVGVESLFENNLIIYNDTNN